MGMFPDKKIVSVGGVRYNEKRYTCRKARGNMAKEVMNIFEIEESRKTNRLYLHVPAYEELWYRQCLLADPDTMAYNKGYELGFDGYDKETGCIRFPEEDWNDWYSYFVGQEPERFYAYIVRAEDDTFIGEVNVHRNRDNFWHDMGIVVEARYRGKGYSVEALQLLLKEAFERLGVQAVHNDFEDVREAAIKAHLHVGFHEVQRENGIVDLMITKEQYDARKSQGENHGNNNKPRQYQSIG